MQRTPTLAFALAAVTVLAGCIGTSETLLPEHALALPGHGLPLTGYHFTSDANRALRALEQAHPGLVDVVPVGASVRGQEMLLAKVTNEANRAPGRPIGFIDGCHHGNENEGCEAPLYAAWFMAANYATNATVRWMLDNFEFHFLPLVNPDGHDDQTRTNANGVNLNRNYPTDHGNVLGLSYPWDQPINGIAGERGLGVPFATESGGAEALNQPETRAVADHMAALGDDFAFYLSFHTNTHSVIVPWGAFNEPRPIPDQHEAVFQDLLGWLNEHTTYQAGRTRWGDTSGNLSYSASGSSMDWAYDCCEVYSSVMETSIGSAGLDPRSPPAEPGKPDAAWWANSTLPYILKLAINADHLQRWEAPVREFPFPAAWEGLHWFPDGAPQERRAQGPLAAEL
jgi:hypothetical protein